MRNCLAPPDMSQVLSNVLSSFVSFQVKIDWHASGIQTNGPRVQRLAHPASSVCSGVKCTFYANTLAVVLWSEKIYTMHQIDDKIVPKPEERWSYLFAGSFPFGWKDDRDWSITSIWPVESWIL